MPELVDTLRLSRGGRFSASAQEFTAIDFETTGLNPGHLIEIAAVRVRADGTVLGELSTLINPGRGIDPGPTHIHRITRQQLDQAPSLGEVLGDFFDLCRGSVVVAHNLPFEKRFLTEELIRLGVRIPELPGVCTLSASRLAFRLPNYRLATVAAAIGITEYAAHTALADAQVCARLVSSLVMTHRLGLDRQPSFPELPRFHHATRLAPRADALPAVAPGWMAQLADRIPTAAVASAVDVVDVVDAVEDAYLEMLTDALADQYISAAEGRALAALAADAGLSDDRVRRIHQGFVEAMRTVAEADGIVTAEEERDLRQVATALGVPHVLDDLRRTAVATRPAAVRVLVLGAAAEADDLRAEVLAAGIQLAKKLTASVTHVATGSDIPSHEPRLDRARELGATVLDLSEARSALGLSSIPPQRTDEPTLVISAVERKDQPMFVPPPTQKVLAGRAAFSGGSTRFWAGRGLMGIGLLLMTTTVLALFGGSPLGAGIFLGVLGVGILLAGWHLTDLNSRVTDPELSVGSATMRS
jgi:DNA polymerase-3 subunit epsilon